MLPPNRQVSWISLRIREPSDDDNLLMVTKKRTFVLEL
jgi:hypothetical protein